MLPPLSQRGSQIKSVKIDPRSGTGSGTLFSFLPDPRPRTPNPGSHLGGWTDNGERLLKKVSIFDSPLGSN